MSEITDSEILATMFRCDTLGQTYAQAALNMGTTRSAVGGIVKRCRDAKLQIDARRLRDHEIKDILDRMLFGGNRAESIAKTFGLSRYAILYLVWWVMHDLSNAGPEQVLNPANAEVIDWPLWWRLVRAGEIAA